MKASQLHILFAVILIGSLAARVRLADVFTERPDFASAVIDVGRAHNLVFQGYTTTSDTDINALTFAAPDCPRPIRVALLDSSFEQELAAHPPRIGADALRYVYIDHVWNTPDRLGIFVQRLKYAALATFGLSQYVPSWHLIRIEVPPQCHRIGAIDWRSVWNRH